MSNSPTVKDIFTFRQNPTSKKDVFFDSHAHIQSEPFDQNRQQIIQNAKDINLRGVVCVGINLHSSQKSLDLHHEHPDFIYPTIGNHPYNANEPFEPIKQLATKNKDIIVGIGETGLDYFKNNLPKEIQKESLLKHAKLAKELDLPLILHLREIEDTWDDCWEILEKANYPKAIFHCFSGTLEQAQKIWSHGYKTSYSLMTTYPRNKDLKATMDSTPLQNLLIETDSPYLPPQLKRGQQNEPSFLEYLEEVMF